MTWRQAVKIDWGTLLLFGGGITLGNLMFETKLAEAVGQGPARAERRHLAVGDHLRRDLHRHPGQRDLLQHGLGQHGGAR